jgi:hypothetical protein
MTIQTKIARGIIGVLMRRYPFLMREAVVGPNAHVHLNPTRKALKGKYPKKGE